MVGYLAGARMRYIPHIQGQKQNGANGGILTLVILCGAQMPRQLGHVRVKLVQQEGIEPSVPLWKRGSLPLAYYCIIMNIVLKDEVYF
jgi:hypothetical protein